MTSKALIIGGGPSIQENLKEYERLGEFPGVVLCTDNSVDRFIQAGYRKFWAISLEDSPLQADYFTPQAVMDHGSEILGGLTADRVHTKTKMAMSATGMKVKTAAKCRGFITSNVGLYCWLVAINEFKCNEIYMIGMDHCYGEGEKPKLDKNSSNPDERELYLHAFQELLNTHNEETVILHPAQQLWHEEFIWYCKKYPQIKTINCTGRGALYERWFKWQPISQLKTW